MTADGLLRRYATGAGAAAGRRAAHAPVQPASRTVIVTCMDARIDTYALFGLTPGDAHVLRNAGGVITDDVIRSIVISQRKLATTDVILVHHTTCGMTTFTDDDFSEELAIETGMRPPWRPRTFVDAAADVRSGMARLARNPFLLRGTPVRGFVLDVDTFALDEVHPAPVSTQDGENVLR